MSNIESYYNKFLLNSSDAGTVETTYQFDIDSCDTTFTIDPLVDWLPYKWKKYIPTWHLVRSYQMVRGRE